ncbi:MAG: hypothetical protein R6X35_11810 [Candidatus Krumholzibacteriia bacterium]
MIGVAVKRIFRGIILGGMVLISIQARGDGNGLFQSQAGDLVVLGLKADLRNNPIGLTDIPAVGTIDLAQTDKLFTPRNDLFLDRRPDQYRL